ncbi:hypothetical protein Tco_1383944 [Tanacetum coccineum]
MDDPNITMEEYIRFEEGKAQRHGRTFNWQTVTYGRWNYKDEEDSFTNFETEYPTIVFDDTSDATLSCKPTVKNENDNVNMPSSPSPEPTIGYIDGLDFFKDFENEFLAITYNDDLKSESDPLIEPSVNMLHLPSRDQRHTWIRYQVEGYGEDIVHSYKQRLETIWGRAVNRVHVLNFACLTEGMRQTLGHWMSDTKIGLDVSDTLCFQLGGARHRMTWRQFILALGLHTEDEMAEAGGILGRLPYYVFFDRTYRSPMPQDDSLQNAEGRKSGARMSGITSLGVLQLILDQVGDTWAWVARGPERQPDAMAGAPRAAEDAPTVDEGAQANPAPMQAPQPPLPAPNYYTSEGLQA